VHGLVVFDLDGTLYRGDAPFRFYAETIARSMRPEDRMPYLDKVRRHLDGEAGVVAADNWEAVVTLAGEMEAERIVEAFRATRAFMMTDECPLEVPEGLVALLRDAGGRVVRAVASNSPEDAAVPLLGKLGLTGYFDVVRHSAGKPDGLLLFADEIIAAWKLPPTRVMSVGDHYRNDIAPARARGWVTAHISPRGYHPGPADYTGRRLEDVLPGIRAWIDDVSIEAGG
jgi:FMN phosphatase YigB (HAD superfamily)